jgi:predicted PurR-regulated permease PerM
MTPLPFLVAFSAMAIFDIVYALFQRALARDSRLVAALYSFVLTALAGTAFVEYASNPFTVAAASLGSLVGTLGGMWADKYLNPGVPKE